MPSGKSLTAIIMALALAAGTASTARSLTVEEVLALKKAGIQDETIRIMMQQEKEGKRPDVEVMGKREIRDGRGNVSVEYSTGGKMSSDASANQQQQVDKAWEMLRHLIVDARKTN